VGGGGSEVGIAEASEDSKRGIVWEVFVKKLIGYMILDGGGSPIEEESGSGKGLSPVGRWHGRMKEHGADGVVCGAKHAFSLAILWRGIRTREAERNAIASEEGGGSMVNELGPIISLE